MSAGSSKISLTLTDLENLNLGQLVRLYQTASGPNRTDPPADSPTDQRSSQRPSRLRTSQLDTEGRDRGSDVHQSHAQNSRPHLLTDQRNIRQTNHSLSTSNLDVEKGEHFYDLHPAVKQNASNPVLASLRLRQSRPLTPGQYDDAPSEPDLHLSSETPETQMTTFPSSQHNSQPRSPGQFDDAQAELAPELKTIPMSQYQTFRPNIPQLDIGTQFYSPRPTYPEPAFLSRYDIPAVPEADVISPASPIRSRWTSLRIAHKPVEVFRTWSWSRPSTSRASRRSKRFQRVRRKPLPQLLTWSGPLDPSNPVNWPPWKKRMIMLATIAITFCVCYGSSIFTAAITPIASEFHTGQEVATLGFSFYVLGFAIGPLIFGPLSEVYGRTRPMFAGLFFFVVLQVPVALAQNLAAIFLCRFLIGTTGSAVIAVFPAMTVDLLMASDRGPAIDLYIAAAYAGPCLGPVTGSFLIDKLNWRWTVWVVLIISAVFCCIGFLVIPETCEAVLLQRKAAQIRYETKNWAMHTTFDEFPITWQSLRQKYMLKPIFMIFQEPILFILTLYTSLANGLLYLAFFAYPFAFSTSRHWATQLATLPFLAILTGLLLGIILIKIFFNPWWNCRLAARISDPMNANKSPVALVIPEDRLPPMFLASILLPTGLFWFAWTSSPTYNYWPQVLSGIFIGVGITGISVSSVSYLVDVYLLNANSALAANTFVRFLFGAAFPLFTQSLYNGLHVDWATSLIGFLAVAMVPFPFLFWYKGERIRGWSKFTFAE